MKEVGKEEKRERGESGKSGRGKQFFSHGNTNSDVRQLFTSWCLTWAVQCLLCSQ